jgi:hypothetical protein
MSKLFLVNIDLNGNEIDNAVIQPLASAPANAKVGKIYYDTTDHMLKTYNGTSWDPAGAVVSVNGQTGVIVLDQDDIGDGSTYKRTHNDLTDALVTLINGAIQSSEKGANSGVAELDANGKVPSSQLPAYVDDVVEGYYYNSKFYKEAAHTTEIPGEAGKIYVDLSTEKTYRWSGSAFVEISASLALGETSSTAYRGDRGKTAYDHSQLTSGNPHNVSKSDVGLGNVDNTSDATKKTNFTGSIASGDTGFVTGGDVYTAVNGVIKTATGTIGTNATTVTVNYSGTLINAYATISGKMCVVDITPNASNVVFTVAASPSSAVTCMVIYA